MTGAINIKRSWRPQSLYKFHFHESSLFRLSPQTSIINKVVLENTNTHLIAKKQGQMLQRSFDGVLKNNENDMESWGNNKTMNKIYSQAYYPFLTKPHLEKYFKDTMNVQLLKNFVLKHVRLNDDASNILKFLGQKPIFDYGVLRSSYFPSLGMLNDYQKILKNANYKVFRHHFERNYNFSDPLSSIDNAKNEMILADYLKKSSQLHKGVANVKNYFVINSPEQSEFFISLSSKLGVSTIVITGDNFITPSSTINNLVINYELARSTRNLFRCQEIHTQLSNMKLISVKNMRELMIMLNILQDPYIRGENESARLGSNSLNSMLNDLELSILGELETNHVLNRL